MTWSISNPDWLLTGVPSKRGPFLTYKTIKYLLYCWSSSHFSTTLAFLKPTRLRQEMISTSTNTRQIFSSTFRLSHGLIARQCVRLECYWNTLCETLRKIIINSCTTSKYVKNLASNFKDSDRFIKIKI